MAQDVLQDGHGLPNTRWSEVEFAKTPETRQGQIALNSLLTRYRPALILHLRTKFHLGHEDAEDTFQTFVEKKILARNFLKTAKPSRGRFRTYLLFSLDRFVISQRRRTQALKRTPGTDLIPLHQLDDEQLPCAPTTEPESIEIKWSEIVITAALLNLQNECRNRGRSVTWNILEDRALKPILEDAERPEYEDLVRRHDLKSPSEAFNLLNTGKRMLRRHLRAVVAEYANGNAEIEEELTHLRRLCESRMAPP